MNKSEEFDKIIQNFYNRNNIQNEKDEKYLRNFRNRLGKFFSQFTADETEVKEIVIECIEKDYKLYTERKIVSVLKNFHESLTQKLLEIGTDLSECLFTSILNKKSYKHNSSIGMVDLYLKVNELPNYFSHNFLDVVQLEDNRLHHIDNPENLKFSHYNDNFYRKESKRLQLDWEKRLRNKRYLILIDDYAGSGKTILDFIEMIKKYIKIDIVILVYCIHVTTTAKKKITKYFDDEKVSGQLLFYEESDKYFKDDFKKRESIRKFRDFSIPLGFDETESILTTYRNSPNNTLELFWNNCITNDCIWRPLFPRDKKDSDSHKNMSKWVKYRKEIRWFMAYKNIPKENTDKMIVLLYIKNTNRLSGLSEIELSKIICYIDEVMQECLEDGLIALVDDKYKLSELGQSFLEEFSLSEVKLKEIRKQFSEKAEEKATPLLWN